MKKYQGVWLPDGEVHLVDWMHKAGEIVDGKGTYQIKKYRMAIEWCKSFRTALDVGAHCGLWSMQMVKKFQSVHSFEPVLAHQACFRMNLRDSAGGACELHECAIGEKPGFVSMKTAPTSSGDTMVSGHTMLSHVAGEGSIPMKCIDDFEFEDVDFIKLDLEGYELFALRGAEETLKRWKPCVIVEQKPGHAQNFGLRETQAVDYLQSLGARLRKEYSGDFILSWD